MGHAGERRRDSFDAVADLYDAGRPAYPPEVVALMLRTLGVEPGTRVLEIGCGTGRFIVELCRAGAEIVAIELGPNLARIARDNLANFANVEVVTAAFEDWSVPSLAFDGVCAAAAFHWLDPAVRLDRCAGALRRGGVLALLHAHHVRGGTEGFFRDSNSIYRRYGLSDEPDFAPPRAADVPPMYPEVDDHPAFAGVERQRIESTGVFGHLERSAPDDAGASQSNE